MDGTSEKGEWLRGLAVEPFFWVLFIAVTSVAAAFPDLAIGIGVFGIVALVGVSVAVSSRGFRFECQHCHARFTYQEIWREEKQ